MQVTNGKHSMFMETCATTEKDVLCPSFRSEGALLGDVQFYCPVSSLPIECPIVFVDAALDAVFVTLVQKQCTKLNNVYLQ
jgi:hypothetical protein